mmetsp:Transcript_81560/g.249152  ORF Transcript_81560/g.249152 Transcript_81560/m.249152 type:complete len:87 (+) Transcript_81560:767-1027(+)
MRRSACRLWERARLALRQLRLQACWRCGGNLTVCPQWMGWSGYGTLGPACSRHQASSSFTCPNIKRTASEKRCILAWLRFCTRPVP